MPLAANLEASFTADGFDLEASISGVGDIFAAVGLPSLDLDEPAARPSTISTR